MSNTADSFKKSLDIVKDNPFITLYFVLYLIVLFLITPFLIAGRNMLIAMILGILMLLLTCAFISGWFNMIKTSTLNYKKDKTPEQKLEEAVKLKNDFFAGVSEYILPVIVGTVIIIGLFYIHSYLSDLIFGKIDKVIYDLSKYTNDTEALKNYFVTLPESTWAVIFKKSIFSYIACSLITLFFLYWSASLYMNKNCTSFAAPFSAIWYAIKVMFKNFFQTAFVFIILMIINFILISIQAFFMENVVISFITMILRIYFAAYIVVLIFDLYEANKLKNAACSCTICGGIQTETTPAIEQNNSNNGTDSIG